jgi:formylglycine-generating enzyme required for sulfatase activity
VACELSPPPVLDDHSPSLDGLDGLDGLKDTLPPDESRSRTAAETASGGVPDLGGGGADPEQRRTDVAERDETNAVPRWSRVGPLEPQLRSFLTALPQDPVPAELDAMSESGKGRHFYCSDEWNLHTFAPALRGAPLVSAADPETIPSPAAPLGGVLIAIGSEQGYMLASWSEPELAFLVDYDPEIVALHEAIDALILAARGPAEFLAWFEEGDARPSLRALTQAEVSPQAMAAYRRGFGRLRRRFLALAEASPTAHAPLWFVDEARFTVIRKLLEEGRIVHARIDLTADVGIAAIAGAVTDLGLDVRVLYLSNAEQYWSYGPGFRANVAALPFDDRSVVLRTLSSHKTNGDYRYNVQDARDFATRLQRRDIRRVYQFVDSRRLASSRDLEFTTTLAPDRDAGFDADWDTDIVLEDPVDTISEHEGDDTLDVDPEPRVAAAIPHAEAPAASAAITAPPPAAPAPVPARSPAPVPEQVPEQAPEQVAARAPAANAEVAAVEPAPEPRPCTSPPEGMVCIPGGTFVRGIDDGSRYARPAMDIWLQTFFIDAKEVTYGAYQACVERGDCSPAKPLYGGFREADMPMQGVDWYQADAYCRAQGKALPTETQWERAARGTDGRTYPWGETAPECDVAIVKTTSLGRGCGREGWGDDREVGRPWPVGSRPPTGEGVFDMAGNAYEWVADWFSVDYETCGAACAGPDPRGPCHGGAETCVGHPKKVVRGGSWYWPAYHATTFHRRAHDPDNEPFHHFGFRCAAPLPE